MKSLKFSVLSILFLVIPGLTWATTWQIDADHSNFQFKIRHLMVSNVKGGFTKAAGVVTMADEKDLSSLKMELTIDAASINTGHAKRDEHLKTADFFDVSKYPTITFVSKKVTKVDNDRIKVTGDLTIRGVTKEVTVEVEGPTAAVKDPWGGLRRGATGYTRINRRDFGINWSKTLDAGGLVVGDEVDIYVEVELVRK